MKWMLVILITWADSPPLTTIQIPMPTKSLCEQGADQAKVDLNAGAGGESVGRMVSGPLRDHGGVLTTCIQISN